MIESQAFYRVLDQPEESDVTDLFSHWSDQLALTVQRSSVRANRGLADGIQPTNSHADNHHSRQSSQQITFIADNYIANNYKADNHSRQSSSQQTIIIIADNHIADNHHHIMQTITISDTRQSSQRTIIIADNHHHIADTHHRRQLYSRQSLSYSRHSSQEIIGDNYIADNHIADNRNHSRQSYHRQSSSQQTIIIADNHHSRHSS